MSTRKSQSVRSNHAKDDLVNEWISAFLASDLDVLATESTGKIDAVRVALLAYLRAAYGELKWEEAERKMASAAITLKGFSRQPSLANLAILVQAVQIHLLAQEHADKVAEAWQSLRSLEAALSPSIPNHIRAYIWHVRITMELQGKNSIKALKSIERALSMKLTEGSLLWYMMMTNRALGLYISNRFNEVRTQIEALRGYHHLDPYVSWSLPLIEALLCSTVGPEDRGLEIIEQIGERGLKVNQRTLINMRIWLLIFTYRFDEAQNFLNSKAMATFSEQRRLVYQTSLDVMSGDTVSAHQHARAALSINDGDVYSESNCILLLAMAHLIDNEPEKARKRLERLDIHPGQNDADLVWMRLLIMEGNEEAAIDRLKQSLMKFGPDGVRIRLKYAHELSTSRLSCIWLKAETALKQTPEYCRKWIETMNMLPANKAQGTKAESQAVLIKGAKDTFSRREQLKELFFQYPRLTRAQAAECLSCAPITAARDLAALESEGVIRRVDTSAHARTSYYQRVDEL